MTSPDWQDSWSTIARDIRWHPVPITVGNMQTDKGARFALLVEGMSGEDPSLLIFVPDTDIELATHITSFVTRRATGGGR